MRVWRTRVVVVKSSRGDKGQLMKNMLAQSGFGVGRVAVIGCQARPPSRPRGRQTMKTRYCERCELYRYRMLSLGYLKNERWQPCWLPRKMKLAIRIMTGSASTLL